MLFIVIGRCYIHVLKKHELQNECAWDSCPEVYHSKTVSKSGRKGWQGGPNLPDSATYTWSFCQGLLACWETNPEIAPAKLSPAVPAANQPQQNAEAVVLLSESDSE